jgi:hypothetical protein
LNYGTLLAGAGARRLRRPSRASSNAVFGRRMGRNSLFGGHAGLMMMNAAVGLRSAAGLSIWWHLVESVPAQRLAPAVAQTWLNRSAVFA